jgi:SecD/SecF fusion protein
MNFGSIASLLAQTDPVTAERSWLDPLPFAVQFASYGPAVTVPTVLLVTIVIPFLLGWVWARAISMPTYWWRIGLILASIVGSIVAIALGWPPKLGVDLKGGWIMIFEIDDQSESGAAGKPNLTRSGNINEDTSNRAALIQKLKQRLNPDGLKEISIRPYGLNEIEIIVPETDRAEIEKLKRQIREQGVMEFLILAERGTDTRLMETARAQSANSDTRRKRSVMEGEREVGRWVKVGREDRTDNSLGVRPLRIVGGWASYLVRNADTGEILDSTRIPSGQRSGTRYFQEQNISDVEVLTKVHERYRVTGADLREGAIQSGLDENGRPSVLFAFKPASASLMGGLTASNLQRQLAIVLDDTLLSHATIQSQISDSGRITGSFTQDEVDFIIRILKSGSLPARVKPQPAYEDPSDPTLGAENIRSGAVAVVVSLATVFVFCLAYYRLAGIVACFALAANILLTVAVMILFGATLTMPGLAGMVLTVGMSVDANVLIFERMREELAKGASFRMAIRNGFERATTTIIDSNLTTLLTAIILYVIGTDQLVGFAVTLTLGLVISMFTAIFCARVIFEVWERTGTVRTLHFMQFLTNSNFDFVRYMGHCITASCIIIGIGLAAAFWRGGGIFDIDLRGGSSIQVALNQPMSDAQMRQYLDKAFQGFSYQGSKVDYTLKPVGRAGANGLHDSFRVDSIVPEYQAIQDRLVDALKNDQGESLLKHYRLTYETAPAQGAMLERTGEYYFTALQNDEAEKTTDEPPAKAEPSDAAPSDSTSPAKTESKKVDKVDDPQDPPVKSTNTNDKPTPGDGDSKPTEPRSGGQHLTATVRFSDTLGNKEGIDHTAVITRVAAAAEAENLTGVRITADHPNWDKLEDTRLPEWNVTITASPEEAQRIFARLQKNTDAEPIWPASKTIGSQIAGNFVQIAVVALIASLLGIIVYIWFRFQNVTWGFAAVVALIHDVLFMLAGIALSYWLQGAPAFLQLTEFKIDLTVIAAFLTLIGYSINDTIVIFDRMRELKGKLPNINRQIVNDAVNQTLSRSILTFLSTFIVVVVLYAVGGAGIHGFAYAMLIGTFVGMYSTVFIAAPFLLMLLNRNPPLKKAA